MLCVYAIFDSDRTVKPNASKIQPRSLFLPPTHACIYPTKGRRRRLLMGRIAVWHTNQYVCVVQIYPGSYSSPWLSLSPILKGTNKRINS